MLNLNHLCLGCMNELEEENKTCKICGWNGEADENSPHQLKCGTVLQGKYLVGKVLGEGGFGITYLGYNLILQEKVAIKEFYPHGFVGRDTTVNSTVMSYVGQESFTEKSKDGFIREAKTMQSLNKVEGIVEMKDVFAENNTVYIVMEYVEGKTLKEYVKVNGNKLPMSTVLKLLEPVMDALEQIHAHNLIHRDISPDNIMVGPDGKVTLLDLGAARQISADGGHSLTVNVKHGYAPMEQYQTHGEQGPWTDIYALCATIYRLITGKVPPSAADRAFDDSMVRPMVLGADITEEQEKILLKGLAPRSGDRYLNMFELRDAFDFTEKDEAAEEVTIPEETISTEDEKEAQKEINIKDEVKTKSKSNDEKIIKIAIAVATIFLIAGISFFSADIIEKNKLEKEYNSAVLLAENGKYEEAIAAFESLGDYKDSIEQIADCNNEIIEKEYKRAIELIDRKVYDKAIIILESLGDYKDCVQLIEKCNYLQENIYGNLGRAQYELEKASLLNKDVVAWIYIPNLEEVNAGVCFSSDKSYPYSKLDIKGNPVPNTYWKEGAYFAHYRNEFGDNAEDLSINTVVFGHSDNGKTNLEYKNDDPKGPLFSQLFSFKNPIFAENTPNIYLVLPDEISVWEIFAVFYNDANYMNETFSDYYKNNGGSLWYIEPEPTEKEYELMLNSMKKRSIYDYDVDVTTKDRILTLSTNTVAYGLNERDNYNFVIVAKHIGNSNDFVVNKTANFIINEGAPIPQTYEEEFKSYYNQVAEKADGQKEPFEVEKEVNYKETVENEEIVNSEVSASDKLNYIQGTWINHDQDNEIYGYKLVIEGSKFVIYNKRGQIVQGWYDLNNVEGTVSYESSGVQEEKFYHAGYAYYYYRINWGESFGGIHLYFDLENGEPLTYLSIGGPMDTEIDGNYFLET